MAKNVLYIFSTLTKSGPVNIIYNLLSYLDRTQYNPIVLTLSPESNSKPSSKSDYEELGVKVCSLNLSRAKGFLSARKQIFEFCKLNDIQTLHLIGFRADILVRGQYFGDFNIVSSIFSNVFDDYSLLYGRMKGKLMAFLHLKSLKGKTVVACSQFVQHELSAAFKADRFLVIPNSVSVEKFRKPDVEERIAARKRLNLNVDHLILIFVGVLIDRKDPLTTIKGFRTSQLGRQQQATLLILGDGPLVERCKIAAQNDNNIIFFGNTSDTLQYLLCADFYISSSLSEGLPTSVLEAISCGIPPILTNIKPHQEILDFCKQSIPAFDVYNFEGLANIIDSLDHIDKQMLRDSWRAVAEREFNSKIMAQSYQSLY